MDKNLMKKYAEFIVKVGVNVGPGQTLIIQSPVEAPSLPGPAPRPPFPPARRTWW